MALPASLLAQLSSRIHTLDTVSRTSEQPVEALAFQWGELDAELPDGGLPIGVTELSSDRALGLSSMASAAIRAAHTRDAKSWCAWMVLGDPLHAPGLSQCGVDLERLLVVLPPVSEAARLSVRVVASGAFDVVVIDAFGFAQATERARTWSDEVFVRKLALSAEVQGTRVVLLTDSTKARAIPWPVALRLEVERTPHDLLVKVAKDRHGRIGLKKARVPSRFTREVG